DITIVQLADRLSEFGLDGRHLKAMMTIAHRQLDLVSRVADPLKHARDENARQRSAETAREVSALLLSLNAAIVKGTLDSILSSFWARACLPHRGGARAFNFGRVRIRGGQKKLSDTRVVTHVSFVVDVNVNL